MQEEKVLTNEEVKEHWTKISEVYEKFDSAPQTHFFTLVNFLRLGEAKNVLEIGCGTGRLLPYALSQKGSDTSYYATDFIDNLVKITANRLEKDLKRYSSSLSLE